METITTNIDHLIITTYYYESHLDTAINKVIPTLGYYRISTTFDTINKFLDLDKKYVNQGYEIVDTEPDIYEIFWSERLLKVEFKTYDLFYKISQYIEILFGQHTFTIRFNKKPILVNYYTETDSLNAILNNNLFDDSLFHKYSIKEFEEDIFITYDRIISDDIWHLHIQMLNMKNSLSYHMYESYKFSSHPFINIFDFYEDRIKRFSKIQIETIFYDFNNLVLTKKNHLIRAISNNIAGVTSVNNQTLIYIEDKCYNVEQLQLSRFISNYIDKGIFVGKFEIIDKSQNIKSAN